MAERELIGGECRYWACIPSRTLLRRPEAKVGAERAEGVAGAALDRGHLRVLADTERQVLAGAWAVGPQASEWIHTAALAVREEIPIARLLDSVVQSRPTTRAGTAVSTVAK